LAVDGGTLTIDGGTSMVDGYTLTVNGGTSMVGSR
jgi:hypothetical protein